MANTTSPCKHTDTHSQSIYINHPAENAKLNSSFICYTVPAPYIEIMKIKFNIPITASVKMKLKAVLKHPHILPYCKAQPCSKILKLEPSHLHFYAVLRPFKAKYINKTPMLHLLSTMYFKLYNIFYLILWCYVMKTWWEWAIHSKTEKPLYYEENYLCFSKSSPVTQH